MEEFGGDKGSSGSYDYKTPEWGKFRSDEDLDDKMAELIKVKEELKRAKDNAMESWLDSRPIIDELERLQAGLATAKNRTSMSNIVIAELKSQLEATNASVKLKVEAEVEASNAINEITCAVDEVKGELEAIKMDIGQERRARSKLKQASRIKTQKLRTLQLTLRAVRIEMEAFGSSADEAIRCVNAAASETDEGSGVEVSQEEYHYLARRAKEETALAQWRVSVSMEQKLAAEASRNLALSRLKDVYSESRAIRRKEQKGAKEERENAAGEKEEAEVEEEAGNDPTETLPRIRVKPMGESDRRNSRREKRTTRSTGRNTKGSDNKKLAKKGKVSLFGKLKRCFVCFARG